MKIDKRVSSLFGVGLVLMLYGLMGHKFKFSLDYLIELTKNPLVVLGVGLTLTPIITLILHIPLRYTDVQRLSTPIMDGGILYTQGGQHQVHYYFNAQEERLYVARDVCRIVGTTPPKKQATHFHLFPLVLSNKEACLTEKDMRTYLISLSRHTPSAKQLLIDLRKDKLYGLPVKGRGKGEG